MKKLLYFIIILVLVDIWVGINLANHQAPFSNPFGSPESRDKAVKSLQDTARKTTDAVERKIDEIIPK